MSEIEDDRVRRRPQSLIVDPWTFPSDWQPSTSTCRELLALHDSARITLVDRGLRALLISRRWVIADAVHPAGRWGRPFGLSTATAEQALAASLRREIRAWLVASGWREIELQTHRAIVDAARAERAIGDGRTVSA